MGLRVTILLSRDEGSLAYDLIFLASCSRLGSFSFTLFPVDLNPLVMSIRALDCWILFQYDDLPTLLKN